MCLRFPAWTLPPSLFFSKAPKPKNNTTIHCRDEPGVGIHVPVQVARVGRPPASSTSMVPDFGLNGSFGAAEAFSWEEGLDGMSKSMLNWI